MQPVRVTIYLVVLSAASLCAGCDQGPTAEPSPFAELTPREVPALQPPSVYLAAEHLSDCDQNACGGCADLEGEPGAGCGTCADGALVCAGTELVCSCDGLGYRALALGNQSTCALDLEGRVSCWGLNHHGQAEAPEGVFLGQQPVGAETAGEHLLAAAVTHGRGWEVHLRKKKIKNVQQYRGVSQS